MKQLKNAEQSRCRKKHIISLFVFHLLQTPKILLSQIINQNMHAEQKYNPSLQIYQIEFKHTELSIDLHLCKNQIITQKFKFANMQSNNYLLDDKQKIRMYIPELCILLLLYNLSNQKITNFIFIQQYHTYVLNNQQSDLDSNSAQKQQIKGKIEFQHMILSNLIRKQLDKIGQIKLSQFKLVIVIIIITILPSCQLPSQCYCYNYNLQLSSILQCLLCLLYFSPRIEFQHMILSNLIRKQLDKIGQITDKKII
eukprot:TRINITY_DN2396_c0_g1_i2.p1 TRINITY_DN2396_c0_g1~~TRINITY_DN2396_c0_g1_i2.p1  ORF type:complete len:254 (+),score=-31.55 TRINITY_DN2396_c0_g1_i2:241-1002(+)